MIKTISKYVKADDLILGSVCLFGVAFIAALGKAIMFAILLAFIASLIDLVGIKLIQRQMSEQHKHNLKQLDALLIKLDQQMKDK